MKKNKLNILSNLANEKGIVLIWLYAIIAAVLITSGSLFALTIQEGRMFRVEEAKQKAFFFAEAGLDLMLTNVRNGQYATIDAATVTANLGGIELPPNSTIDTRYCDPGPFPGVPLNEQPPVCSLIQELSDNQAKFGSLANLDNVKAISSTATYDGQTESVMMIINSGAVPPGVLAAISTTGNMMANLDWIDGRDHDSDGNLTGEPGLPGLTTGGVIGQYETQSNSPQELFKIGGNGIAPSNPFNPQAVAENSTEAQAFTTPESILGVKKEDLDKYKVTSMPTLPFKDKIVYLTDTPPGDLTDPANEGVRNEKFGWVNLGTKENPSTGILIVDNPDKHVGLNMHGHFKGLIIASDFVDMPYRRAYVQNGVRTEVPAAKGEILGAVVFTSQNQTQNCLNSSGIGGKCARISGGRNGYYANDNTQFIKYSSEIIKNLPQVGEGESGSSSGVSVQAWGKN